MQLRNKYYTHPVITPNGQYYSNSSFSSNVESKLDGYNVVLSLTAELVNTELENMLREGDAIIIHHIECPQTCFRRIIKSQDYCHQCVLKDSEVNGLIQICTFLVANKEISNYSSDDFSPDYTGFKFNLDKGCVLAVGNQINLQINKNRDELANTESIFSIIPVLDESFVDMDVNIESQKIIIRLPKETHSLYSRVKDVPDIQPIMHSIIIIPALEKAIYELKNARDQLELFYDYRWYRSLEKACKNIGIELTTDYLSSVEPLTLAQKLINSPVTRAISAIGNGGSDDED